jgi:hypothetical protein
MVWQLMSEEVKRHVDAGFLLPLGEKVARSAG